MRPKLEWTPDTTPYLPIQVCIRFKPRRAHQVNDSSILGCAPSVDEEVGFLQGSRIKAKSKVSTLRFAFQSLPAGICKQARKNHSPAIRAATCYLLCCDKAEQLAGVLGFAHPHFQPSSAQSLDDRLRRDSTCPVSFVLIGRED